MAVLAVESEPLSAAEFWHEEIPHWLSTLSNPHGSAIRTLKSQVPTLEQMQALARLTFANALAQVPKHRRRAGLPDFDFE